MIPVWQTDASRSGNCFPAAIASVMELDLGQVPDVRPTVEAFPDMGAFWAFWREWLREFGLTIYVWPAGPENGHPWGWALMIAQSVVYPDQGHVLVVQDGEVRHDPNPEAGGAVGEPLHWIAFGALDPADPVRHLKDPL